jgi:hypothetical protein
MLVAALSIVDPARVEDSICQLGSSGVLSGDAKHQVKGVGLVAHTNFAWPAPSAGVVRYFFELGAVV